MLDLGRVISCPDRDVAFVARIELLCLSWVSFLISIVVLVLGCKLAEFERLSEKVQARAMACERRSYRSLDKLQRSQLALKWSCRAAMRCWRMLFSEALQKSSSSKGAVVTLGGLLGWFEPVIVDVAVV